MKQFYFQLLVYFSCLATFIGCGANRSIIAPVTSDDFKKGLTFQNHENQAVIISQIVDTRIRYLVKMPWQSHGVGNINRENNVYCWIVTVEDKIYLPTDDVLDSLSLAVDYFNPRNARYDLMIDRKMWLYEQSASGKIKNRMIRKGEIVRTRLNDSISRIKLRTDETLKGKVLVRKYAFLLPYFNLEYNAKVPYLAKISPWIFQRDVPLLFGKYEILIPTTELYGLPKHKNKIIILGDGNINIQREKVQVPRIILLTTYEDASARMTKEFQSMYDAEKITATVKNIMPLPPESQRQPLGIEIIRSRQ